MATKDLLDSNNAKNYKPAANMNPAKAGNADKKKHTPCKNSLPT